LEALLAPAWRSGRDDFAFNASLDAVCARLVLVAADLALLAEHTTRATGQLHGRQVRLVRQLLRLLLREVVVRLLRRLGHRRRAGVGALRGR